MNLQDPHGTSPSSVSPTAEREQNGPQHAADPARTSGALEKTAPRPHPITIWLGLLSPSLSVVAVVISIYNLYVSDHSQRVSNRAYVTFEEVLIHLDLRTTPSHNADVVFVTTSLTLQNSGSTPAMVSSIKLRYSLPDQHEMFWHENEFTVDVINARDVTIPGKGPTVLKRKGDTVDLRGLQGSYYALREGSGYMFTGRRVFAVTITLAYRDIFGDRHELSVCRVPEFLSDNPRTCSAVEGDKWIVK